MFSTGVIANPSQSLTPTNPAYVIHKTLDKITTFSSNSDKVNPVKLRGFIENQIIPHFDFDNMSHWITGRYARNMTDKDKSEFQRSLRETFLTSLSKHLGSFDAENTRVKFYPARYRGRDEAFVSTTVYRPDRIPVRLDFRMRRAGDGWKIIDVKANGSSAVLYYRRHFISQLRQYRRPYGNSGMKRPAKRATQPATPPAAQSQAVQPVQQTEQKHL
jgi:phospholipid transport system substrate-binding protein